MKDLFLIRHAHAGPHVIPDGSRHLSIRGLEEAKSLKEYLLEKNVPLGFWHISNTNRTKETAEILMKNTSNLGEDINEYWYHAKGPEYVEKLVSSFSPVLYLVAHNPSISYVASYFSGEMIQMGTAACIHLHWPIAENWAEIIKGSAIIKFYK